MPGPELSVVVPSHERPLRLRWLLNALTAQTLDPSRWEVVVGTDSGGEETDELLRTHPLAREGRLRFARLPAGTGSPSTHRNAALALARAPAVVFTDDDCRPPEAWLENVLAAVDDHPGAVVQGPVAPDPDELTMLRSPFPHTLSFTDVPRWTAECANIVYPRELLVGIGGFHEGMMSGEDAELALRAQAAGAPLRGDQRMLTYHAVHGGGLRSALRGTGRWSDLALMLALAPSLRSHLFLRVFWKRSHALLLLALLGAALSRRRICWPRRGRSSAATTGRACADGSVCSVRCPRGR
jgi:GT2 family glycosyltransferase